MSELSTESPEKAELRLRDAPALSNPWRDNREREREWSGPLLAGVSVLLVAAVGSLGVALQARRETSPEAGLAIVAIAMAVSTSWHVGRRRPVLTAGITCGMLLVLLVLAVPVTGGRQLLLTFAGVTIAFGATAGWPALRWWHRQQHRSSPLAIGFVVAAQVTWFRLAPQWLTLALLAAATTIVLVSALQPAKLEAVERRLTTAVAKLAGALAALVAFLVALPLLYLPGAIAQGLDRLRGRSPATAWSPYDVPPELQRRDSDRPFASTSRPGRRRGMLVSSAATILTVVVCAAFINARWSDGDAAITAPLLADEADVAAASDEPSILALENATAYSKLPAFEGVSWADQLQASQTSGTDTRSELFNVEEGLRRTIEPPDCETCPSATVWLTGGSAAFGTGQRDGHTVASELVRLAARDGISLTVVNLGRPGAFMAEEVQAVEQRLAAEPPPDMVLSYSGWNDVLIDVTTSFVEEQAAENLDLSGFMAYIEFLNDHPEEFLDSGVGLDAGRTAAARHVDQRNRMKEVTEPLGIRTRFFLQPDALVSEAQLEGYEELSGITPEEFLSSPFAVAVQQFARIVNDETVDLRGLFVDLTEPTFLGLVHQNESGAAIAASAIYREVSTDLRAVSS